MAAAAAAEKHDMGQKSSSSDNDDEHLSIKEMQGQAKPEPEDNDDDDDDDDGVVVKANTKQDEEKEEEEAKKDEQGNFGSYFRLFKFTDRWGCILYAISFICSIVSGATLPLMTIVFGSSITNINAFSAGVAASQDFHHEIVKDVLWFVYIFIAKFVLTYIATLCSSIAAIRTTRAVREAFVEKMLRREVWHFDTQTSGAIAIQVSTNAARINKGLSDQLSTFIQSMSQFFAAFIVALAVSPILALITLSVIPAMFLITSTCIFILTKLEVAVLRTYSRAGKLAEEAFSSIRTVQAFWAHTKMVKQYDAYLDQAYWEFRFHPYLFGGLFSGQYFCIYAGIALAYWQGFTRYQSGSIPNAGHVFVVVFSVIIAATSVTAVISTTQTFSLAAAAASELFEQLDQPSKLDPLDDSGQVPDECIGNIEVRNLQFAYPSRPKTKILKGLELSIPAGKTTALVGPSGCGKSTIIGLLERWYERAEGDIKLDGVDISHLNIKWLRSRMRLVQQEPVLFSGTVFQNVANGFVDSQRKLSSEEQMRLVQDACKASYAHEFIEELPDGYSTYLGERGNTLSGGQRQRIAIARSIISDPKILLLDEATSALDPKAEKIVQQALNNVSVDRTTLVIAHRLATIKNADSIAVIADGIVAEQGSHDKLMEAGGLYAKLVAAQDLSGGSDDKGSETRQDMPTDEKVAEFSLSREKSRAESSLAEVEKGERKRVKTTMGYSLLRCLLVTLAESRDLWKYIPIQLIVSCIGAATYPGQAVLFSKVLTVFTLHGPEAKKKADFYALMFFVIALGNLVAYSILGYLAGQIARKVTRRYRSEIFENIIRQDVEFFDSPENTPGALTAKISELPDSVTGLLCGDLWLMLIIIISVISTSIVAIAFDYRLGLVLVLVGLPPLLLAGYGRIRLEMALDDKNSASFAKSAGLANEALVAIKTVSSLTLESTIIADYAKIQHNIVRTAIPDYLWMLIWYSLSQAFQFLVMALGLGYGSQLLLSGKAGFSQFYVTFIGVIFAAQFAAQFFGYTSSITKAQAAVNYMFWLRTQKPTVQEDASNKHSKPNGDDGSVELSSLNFRYPSRTSLALNNISLTISSGEFAAFVGPSGCGKSTMINLLERFYDPTSGEVIFANQDISTYSPRLYRNEISLVQQEPTLFSGTVRENVLLGLEADNDDSVDGAAAEKEANDSLVLDACRQANAHDFIQSLPEGLNTRCGNRGLQFSGGQKQRIAIARALIRKPRLLLLDEATSALDTESERVVQSALNQAKEGRTTIAVAHRLSTIKHADRIFVFGHGRIVEQGTHAALQAKRGRYYEMCLAQSLDKAV